MRRQSILEAITNSDEDFLSIAHISKRSRVSADCRFVVPSCSDCKKDSVRSEDGTWSR